jgi:hypothetical protein
MEFRVNINLKVFFCFAEDKKVRLAEEVSDCGPLVDIEKTPGCSLLKDEFDPKAEFPDCCPKYDCEEGIEIVYISAKNKEEPKQALKAEADGVAGEKTEQ